MKPYLVSYYQIQGGMIVTNTYQNDILVTDHRLEHPAVQMVLDRMNGRDPGVMLPPSTFANFPGPHIYVYRFEED